MKFKFLRPLLLSSILLVTGGLVALAAYTADGRELVSLRYLEDTFLPKAVLQGENVLKTHEDALYQGAMEQAEALYEFYRFRLGELDGSLLSSPALRDTRFKEGDVLRLGTGSSLLLLAGQAKVAFPSGAVVDVTAGEEVFSENTLQINHRYLVAERTLATVTVTSDTAVLSLEGSYSLTPGTGPDYNQLADALKTMGLFRGSDTGYGQGYDLEKAPTRMQGLILFLRLMGEEEAALSSTAPCPFVDLPDWCRPYGAYAYKKGYTKGISATEFGPNLELRSSEYVTFLLRALGYSDSGEAPDFTWDSALPRGLQLGLLTPREHKMLTEDPFLRAQAAYLSYYALDAKLKTTGETLYTHLTVKGALDPAVCDAARKTVTSARMK